MALGSVEVEVFQFILRRAEVGWFVSSHDCNFRSKTAAPERIPPKTHPETPEKIQTTCSPFSEVLNSKATWLLSIFSS